MKIGNRNIGLKYEPFIIAEMSGNHNQSLDRAIEIVETASKTGIHAIKLQTYTADTITLNIDNNDFRIIDDNSLWNGRSLYDLYEEAHTPWSWHKPIFERAKELDILCFSSPFDETAVDFLEELNAPAYKIASPEIVHIPLIKKVISTGKPVIVSTGMATLEEIEEVVNLFKDSNNDLALLKCTSSYPASSEFSNIKTIKDLRKNLNVRLGFPIIHSV